MKTLFLHFTPTEKKIWVNCEFEDKFLCGYRPKNIGQLSWMRMNSREIYHSNGPKGDRNDDPGLFHVTGDFL